MIQLSSTDDVRAAISNARDVAVLAYTLRRGPVLDALEAAATRGARVKVRLEGAPYGDPDGALALHNRRIAEELARFGIDAQLARAHPDGDGEAPMHAKALVAGDRVFLDDRNWGADDFVVVDGDRDAVRAVVDAVDGKPPIDSLASDFALENPARSREKRNSFARRARAITSSSKANLSGTPTLFTACSTSWGNEASLRGCSSQRAKRPPALGKQRRSRVWRAMA